MHRCSQIRLSRYSARAVAEKATPPRARSLPGVSAEYLERAEAVLDSLQSFFIEMPRGNSFCERGDFERGYRAFREETRDGADLSGDAILRAIAREPRCQGSPEVPRCDHGFSPP
jgi:hypothetical protein